MMAANNTLRYVTLIPLTTTHNSTLVIAPLVTQQWQTFTHCQTALLGKSCFLACPNALVIVLIPDGAAMSTEQLIIGLEANGSCRCLRMYGTVVVGVDRVLLG